ncbi:MAG: hypothetical protein QXM16_09180 [Nitrososphaerota archaeon]
MKDLKDPNPQGDLKIVELSERVARLETLTEEMRDDIRELKEEMRNLRMDIRAEIRRLDAKIDRFFWLWVATVAAGIALRILGIV